MARCFSYIRFSTAKQGAEGKDSLRRQIAAAERWARDHGMEIDPLTFRDLGVSGYKGKHALSGKLGLFLRAIEDGTVHAGDFLLVERIDRLTRQEPLDAFDLIRQIVDAGITVVTVGDGQEYSRKSLNREPGRIYVLLGAIQAAHVESQARSERLKGVWEAKHAAMAAGEKTRKKAPGWLVWNDVKKCYVENEHADTVRAIFDLAAAGESAHGIALKLNERKVPVFGAKRKSKTWLSDYVIKILNSRTVIGEMQATQLVDGAPVALGQPVADFYPRTVKLATFQRVEKLKGARVFQGGTTSPTATTNLLTRRLFCQRCGATVVVHRTTRNGNEYAYYMCRNRKRGGGCSCVGWRKQTFEGRLLGSLAREIDLEALRSSDEVRAARTTAEDRAASLAEEIAQNDRRLRTLTERVEDPDFPASQLKTTYRRIDDLANEAKGLAALLEEAEAKREALSGASAGDVKRQREIESLLGSLDDEDARRRIKVALASLVDRVDLFDDAINVTLRRGGGVSVYVDASKTIAIKVADEREAKFFGALMRTP